MIGNGDIKTAEDAVRLQRQTGCAAIMIARGSFGQPWIFDQTRALLDGQAEARGAARSSERFAIALEHARMAEAYEADPRGAAIEFRKHLGWYVKGSPGSAELRKKLHAVVSFTEVEDVFASYLATPHRYEDGRGCAGQAERGSRAVASSRLKSHRKVLRQQALRAQLKPDCQIDFD